jgi:MFS family permease
VTPYQRFVAASGLTNLADGVAVVAWAWAASLLTRDALWVAVVPVALRLPWFLFALPAGVVTDRVDRRRLIISMDVMRGAAFAAAAGAIWVAGELPAAGAGISVPWLYALIVGAALLVGAAEVFRDNAAQTMLPSLVPDAELERANGRLWSVELLANALIGPAAGAFLIGLALGLPFALNALAYAVAVLVMLGVGGRFQPERADPRPWRAELGEGLAFLMAAPLLRVMAVTTGFWNLFHQMIAIALVLHAQENLGLSAFAYGLVLAAGAVGGVVGSLIGPWVAARLGRPRTMQWALVASAPAFVWMAVAPDAISLAISFMVFELTGLIWNIVSVSTRQRLIPDRLLGRVNSFYRLLAWGMMPVGLVASGLIVRLAEGPLAREAALVAPFWVAAGGMLVLASVAWRPIGRGFAGLDEKV